MRYLSHDTDFQLSVYIAIHFNTAAFYIISHAVYHAGFILYLKGFCVVCDCSHFHTRNTFKLQLMLYFCHTMTTSPLFIDGGDGSLTRS